MLGHLIYSYDAADRVHSVGGVIYVYNAEGERVAKENSSGQVTASYVLGPGGVQLAEVNGAGQWQHSNVYALGHIIATYDASGTRFQLDDAQGSRRVQANADGTAGLTCFSYPYGDGLSCSGPDEDATEQHFTGKQYDPESGNYYFGARYDADNYGRFLTPDWSAKVEPVPYAKLDNPQSLNLYAFVLDNPVSAVDGTGHDSIAAAEQQVQENANSAKEQMGWYLMYMAAMAQQQLSANGLKFIEQHEGFRGKIYPDQAGHKTIGYGHKILPGEDFSKGITKPEALALLKSDVKDPVAEVNAALGGPVAQNQFDALVDLAFNEGQVSVARGNEMMNAIGAGDVGESNFTAYRYIHVGGKPVVDQGLLDRREDEWLLYSKGVY